MTFLELILAMAVLIVAIGIFATTITGTSKQRAIAHENRLASEAVRSTLEAMRNEEFAEVYALYNSDPFDDPGGPGTAPGNRFAIDGLTALPGVANDRAGEVILPAVLYEVHADGSSTPADLTQPAPAGYEELWYGGAAPVGASPGPPLPDGTELVWQLREDFADDELGMPRDLNGDNVVDEADHRDSYIILPVRVRVQWVGMLGRRNLELCTMLCEFKK